MQTYGQFDVLALDDNVPIWRDRDEAETVAFAKRGQKLRVVRREGALYCIRMMGIGYGYIRPDAVVSEAEALRQRSANKLAYAGASTPRSGYPTGAFPGDQYTGFSHVGFLERLIAYLVDYVLLFAIFYAIAALLGVQAPGFYVEDTVVNGVEGKRYWFYYWAGGQESIVGNLASFVAALTYWIGSWTLLGATPGKMLLGQQIVHAQTGGRIGFGAAVLRYIGTIISAIPLCLGYLWIIWDAEKQGWHDKIANTRVVRTR
jgi:uncharacterized RDD family membrane protein YckC